MSKKDYPPKVTRSAEDIEREIAEQQKIVAEANERKDANEKIAKPLREKKAKAEGGEKKKLVKKATPDTPPVASVGDLDKDGTKKLDTADTKNDDTEKVDKQTEMAQLKQELEKAVLEAKYAKGSEQKVKDIENRIKELENEISGGKKDTGVEDIKKDINKTFQAQEKENQDKSIVDKLKIIGLSENDFASNKEWQTFSNGEKLLVLEQISQETLSHVKEIGEKRFQEKYGIHLSWNPKKWNPLGLGKKIWKNVTKSVWISKEEKRVIAEAEAGKLKPNEEATNQIIERTADMHLNVIEKDGRAVIEFIPIDKSLPVEQQKIIEEYNRTSNEFARMPDSWRNEKAAKGKDYGFHKKNYDNFQKIKTSHEKAKADLLKLKEEQYLKSGVTQKEAVGKAMLEVKDSDFQIAILQFVNTNPDVVKELNKIKNESSWGRLANKENLWRVGYMAIGAGAKSTTVSLFGLFAAPIVAGAIGGIRARTKAEKKINLAFGEGRKDETFRERKEAGKKGLFDDKDKNRNLLSKTLGGYSVSSKEVGAFIDTDSQIQRLDNILGKIDQAKTDEEKLRFKDQLIARINYIEDKNDAGLINYGSKNAIGLNYELYKKLSFAKSQLSTLDFIDNIDRKNKKIERGEKPTEVQKRENLLYQLIKYNEAKFGKKQAHFKTQEMLRGATVGAGFAVLGGWIRNLMSTGGEEMTNNFDSGFSNPENHTLPGHDEIISADKAIEHASVEATANNGQGAISTIRELQDNLKAEYGEDLKINPDQVPASVKHILGTDAGKLAQEYGMYKPGQDAESALDLKSMKVDGKTGDITYQTMRGETDIKVSSNYEGNMIDSDNSGVEVENTDAENIITEREPVNISRMESIDEAQVSTDMVARGAPEVVDIDNPDQDAGPGEVENGNKIVSGVSETKAVNIEEVNNNLSSLTFAKGEIFNSPAGYENFTAEEMTQIFKAYDHDLNHLFSDNRMAWLNIKNSVSTETLMSKFEANELNDTYLPLARYINRLEEVTDLTPESATEINPAESIPNFIYRALHEAKKLNKLDAVGL